MSTSMMKKHLLSMLGFVVFGLLALGSTDTESGGSGGSESSGSWETKNNSLMAYIMMEDFVKQRLKAPGTAKFPSIWEGRKDHVESLGDNKYRITSYVDAQNSFGAQIRTKFVGEIEQVTSEKWQWQLLSLTLL